MRENDIRNVFLESFDVVSVIKKDTFISALKKPIDLKPIEHYQTLVVLGLSYPKRIIKHTKTHLVPSFYTFGKDYHFVLKTRIENICHQHGFDHLAYVDNHPFDERLAATIGGLGFFGKNQLIINKTYGSYMFL